MRSARPRRADAGPSIDRSPAAVANKRIMRADYSLGFDGLMTRIVRGGPDQGTRDMGEGRPGPAFPVRFRMPWVLRNEPGWIGKATPENLLTR